MPKSEYTVIVIDAPDWKVAGVEVVADGSSIRVVVEEVRSGKRRVGNLSAGELAALMLTLTATYS